VLRQFESCRTQLGIELLPVGMPHQELRREAAPQPEHLSA
jgi:hypothetical protein